MNDVEKLKEQLIVEIKEGRTSPSQAADRFISQFDTPLVDSLPMSPGPVAYDLCGRFTAKDLVLWLKKNVKPSATVNIMISNYRFGVGWREKEPEGMQIDHDLAWRYSDCQWVVADSNGDVCFLEHFTDEELDQYRLHGIGTGEKNPPYSNGSETSIPSSEKTVT